MSLLHAVISRGPIILAEKGVSSEDASYSSAVETILSRIPPNSSKLTYAADEHLFHYIRDSNDVTVLCMADDSLGRRVPFAFLAELQKEFLSSYSPGDIADAPPYGMNAFASRIGQLMRKYETSPPNDAIREAQAEISNVKDIMVKNVEQILSRGERLDLLIDKTDGLSTQAKQFRKRSAAIRRKMWWKNTKLLALSSFAIVVLIYLLIASFCGAGMQQCRKSRTP